MRKISRLSLVAAIAVAGFTAANAQPLEQAIKDVEVSGSVVYRYDNFDNDKADTRSSQKNNYKIGLNLSSKVNDYVKFNSRFIVGSQTHGGFASLDAKKDGTDGQADVSLSNAYFSLTAIPNTVINVGKQGLTSPYTVATDINGNEQTGTGILALTNVGPVTLGGGYFNNTNLGDSAELNGVLLGGFSGLKGVVHGESLYVATIQADFDFIKLESWYAGLQDIFNTYTLAATGNVKFSDSARMGVEARYVNLDLQKEAAKKLGVEEENAMFRLAVDGKFSIVNARLAWIKTDKKGGLTALDQDAKNTSLGWALTSNGIADANYYQAALGIDILDNLNLTANYGYLKSKDKKDHPSLMNNVKAKEYYGQLTYKMSKNLTTILRYGKVEVEEYKSGDEYMDQNRGRIQVNYTF